VGKVESVVSFDSHESLIHSYKRWMNLVKTEEPGELKYPDEKEIATIIYTSGTTGNPKGVELSHENLMANIHGLNKRWGDEMITTRTVMGFLPWAHIFGQTCELHQLFAGGHRFAIIEKR
jgi:long-chain acyl-CoA synthetase